jgi:hypothetical protein
VILSNNRDSLLVDIMPDKELQILLRQWRMIYSYYIKNLKTNENRELDETLEETIINHQLVVPSI